MTAIARRLQRAEPHEIAFLDAERDWLHKSRRKQIIPLQRWTTCIAQAGRGWGKTAVGSAWVRRCVGLYPGCIVHVVAPTYGDLRGVIFNGMSGLLNSIPAAMIKRVNNSLFEIELWNGSLIRGFSAESPDRLRGPQCHFLWGDELAAWGNTAEAMLTNIDMSTRLTFISRGRRIQPQKFYTTTPRPLEWLKNMVSRPGVLLIRGTTMENRANLAESFIEELEQYEGTQIYRQEVLGELIDIGESAIIKRSWLKLWPKDRPIPWLDFVFVSTDTAFTEKTFDKKTYEPDYTATTVWGVFAFEKRWNMILLECWHEQMGFPELVSRMRREMKATYGRRKDIIFKPLIGPSQIQEQVKHPDLLIVEDRGSGISLRQMLANEGIDSWPYNPGRADKLARLHAISHVAAAGRIWIPESAKVPNMPRSWAEPMLDEVCVYSGPGTTRHDDFVDSFSQGTRYFADRWLNAGVMSEIKPDSLEVDVGGVDIDMSGLDDQGREITAPYD